MPRKERDYAAEYARRIERAEGLGYSRSWARGHPQPGEVSAASIRKLRAAPQVAAITIPSEKTPYAVGYRDPKTGKVVMILVSDAELQKLIDAGIIDQGDIDGTPTGTPTQTPPDPDRRLLS